MPGELEVVHVPEESLLRSVRWVATSELEDPTPFLLGGELLLTAGIVLAGASRPAIAAYVERLVRAGVTALGLGVSPVHDAVPAGLGEACLGHALPLLRIPESIPFVAVTRKFAGMLEAESDRAAQDLLRVNRRMLRAVLSTSPERELLAVLARELNAWVVLTDDDGRVAASAGQQAVPREQLRPLQHRILAGKGPRVEVTGFEAPRAAHVVGHPLRNERDINLGTLVLGSDTGFTPPQTTAISLAVGLLEVLLRQRSVGNFGPSRLATALLLDRAALMQDPVDTGRTLARLLAQSMAGTERNPMRIVQGSHREQRSLPWPPPAPEELQELIQLRRLLDTRLVDLTDYGFAAITRSAVPDRVLSDLEQLGWIVAVGEPVGPAGLPDGNARVAAARRRACTEGASVRLEDLQWSVTGLLGAESGRLIAGRLFSPLDTLPEERRRLLVQVLRCWLDAHGNWDASGRALGMHRNTVRRHIQHIADLLRLDMDDASNRAELLIALQFMPES
ncbi:PucR family transcriptional regulator [uncultured Arthrobacter sp.]|uniref:PucR family transcriptional regulator n=1 Tax=uncultured Arthrobacter sp. TaxID=114050 RepID=UPI0025D8AD71|nr:PucR family transcriptional regulator [uncultured Arthrobacter sp.]